jgi:hypothetical protein
MKRLLKHRSTSEFGSAREAGECFVELNHGETGRAGTKPRSIRRAISDAGILTALLPIFTDAISRRAT